MKDGVRMDESMARVEAAKLMTDMIHGSNSALIAFHFPDPLEAQRVQKAMMTADIHMTWTDSWPPRKDRAAKIVGAAASPLLVPVIGCLWVIWWMESVRKSIVRRWRAERRG